MKTTLLSLSLLLALGACQVPQQVPGLLQSTVANKPTGVTTLKVGKVPHGIAAAAGFVYNSNTGDGTISVIDSKTDKVVKTLSLGNDKPGYIKASHGGQHLLVLSSSGKLHVYDPAQAHKLLQSVELGTGPDKLLLSNDDRKVWVSLTAEANIAEVNFEQGFEQPATVKKMPVGKASADGKGHRALALSQSWLATPNPGENDLSLVSRSGGESQRVSAGNEPAVLGFGSWNGADRSLIIGNKASHTITLYHLDTQIGVTLKDVGNTPTDIALVPELERAFVTMSGSNEVAVIDYRQQKLLARIPVGQRPVHIYRVPAKLQIQHVGHDHGELWVGNDAGSSVSLIDPDSLKVKTTIPVGKGHHKMAFWSHKAYISNITDGSVSIIDRSRLGN
ncbi:MAG: hypothetical protein CVV27_09890 [Candidatus Melainabacteria bacterium HGW-Melainabacteria-1]|nr:MAG: hypothetical protein CVV27_09890 [Candidatus Melainabacteria bacterium HGW-Melainabacteria-1]